MMKGAGLWRRKFCNDPNTCRRGAGLFKVANCDFEQKWKNEEVLKYSKLPEAAIRKFAETMGEAVL